MGWAAKPGTCGTKRELGVRIFDVVGASILLLLLVPMLVLIALGVVLDSRGPIFYGAERVGRYGKTFRMLKFRKMRVDAEGPRLTTGADARFTRFGRLLAKSKLDELPQLWNVVKGEMSLVGPRPEDRAFVELLQDDYQEILQVPPGITGLSQLAFAKESQLLLADTYENYYVERLLPQKMSIDRLYARKRSLRLNLQIMFWTLVVLSFVADVAVNRKTGSLTLRKRSRVADTEAAGTEAALAPEPPSS